MKQQEPQPAHPWKARLGVGLVMLTLAFLGMVTTDVHSTGGWEYWKWVVPIYALLALWLSWYVKRSKETVTPITLWHEVLHWAGLILAIFLVSHLSHLGTISRFVAGIFQLILLSFAVFLAGVYIEPIFLLIGLALAILAMATAMFVQYIYAIAIPLLIAAAIAIALWVWLSHQKSKSQQ